MMALSENLKAAPTIGYFEHGDDKPKVNPAIDGTLCPYCGDGLTRANLRTVSVMAITNALGITTTPQRCYFYRVHRTCAETASPALAQKADEIAMGILQTN